MKIEGNLFRNNGQGLRISRDGYNPVVIARNTFLRNGVGLSITPHNLTSSLQIKDNNFLLSDEFNVMVNWTRSDLIGSCDLSGNWWGTIDTTLIAQSIYDQEDDFKLVPVTYEPFLKSAVAGTPPPLHGDINWDNKVDLQDLTLLASAYRSHQDDPVSQDRYNPTADLNADKQVNLQDLTILASNYRTVANY